MRLLVYSLKNTLFEGEAESLNCQTAVGEITVLDNHEPLISVLRQSVLKIIDKNKKEHFIEIKGGFLEVRSNSQVRCLVD